MIRKMNTERCRDRFAVLMLVALFVAVLGRSPVSASEPDPATLPALGLVSEVIDRVLAELAKKDVEQEAKIKALESIVFEKFNFQIMSRLVLARNFRKFTKPQQVEFEEEFKQYLSRFYGSRLVDYADEKVEITGTNVGERGDVTVMTRIVGGDVDGIEMSYRVRERNDTWKIIDVTIEGVSTVRNFHSQFREIISQGGPEKLLVALRTKTLDESEKKKESKKEPKGESKKE
jgi:phospholipid transport system substrate-binding protein